MESKEGEKRLIEEKKRSENMQQIYGRTPTCLRKPTDGCYHLLLHSRHKRSLKRNVQIALCGCWKNGMCLLGIMFE